MLKLDRRSNLEQRDRFERLHRELLERLVRVLPSTPQHDLQELASRMIRLRLKYEQLNGLAGFTPRA